MASEQSPSANEGGGKSEGQSAGRSDRRRSYRSRRRRRNKPSRESSPPPRPAPGPSQTQDETQREQRDRRRRRRAKSKRRGQSSGGSGRDAADIMQGLPSLQPVFVYTHVIRPSARDSYEFRTEHFGKSTRRLEDFNIDLSPFFRGLEEDGARLEARQRAEAEGIDADEAVDDDWDDDWDGDDEDDEDGAATGPAAEAGDDDPVDLDPTDNDDELS